MSTTIIVLCCIGIFALGLWAGWVLSSEERKVARDAAEKKRIERQVADRQRLEVQQRSDFMDSLERALKDCASRPDRLVLFPELRRMVDLLSYAESHKKNWRGKVRITVNNNPEVPPGAFEKENR